MNKVKISIRLFVIIIGLLLFTQLPVFATEGTSTVTNLRIRKTASTNGEVIEVLAQDEKVEILEEEGDWYKISARGVTGYVSKTYVKVKEKPQENNNAQNNENNNQQVSEQPNNNQNVETNNNENTNNQQQANNNQQSNSNQQSITNKVFKISENTQVNILPVLTSEVLGEVKKDEEVTLINNAGLWAYIKAKNFSGWIRIDKLSTENVNVDNTNTTDNTQKNEDNTQNNVDNTQNNTDNTENTPNNSNVNASENNSNSSENNNKEENNNQQNAYTPKKMYVKSTTINVRAESNTSSDIVTSLSINTEVSVVGEENGWYKVNVNGKSGYIRNDLLSNEKTEVSSRNDDIDRTTAQNNTNTANNSSDKTTSSKPSTSSTQTTNNSQTTNTAPAQNNTTTKTSSSGVTGEDIVAYAKQFLGCRYVYGAAGPNSFDCSGLTMYVYKHFGYSLSHSSKVQATQGKKVTGELQPGDILVFTNGGSAVGHVGIYIGNDKFIHASDSTTGVIISNLSDRWNKSKYLGARRIL